MIGALAWKDRNPVTGLTQNEGFSAHVVEDKRHEGAKSDGKRA